MYWLEVTVLAVILFMYCVRVNAFVVVLLPYSPASVTTGKWVVLITQFDSCMAAYGASSGTKFFVNLR